MKRGLLICLALALLTAAVSTASADTSASISVKVTLRNVSVSLNLSEWQLGTVVPNSVTATAADYFVATNDGNVAEDFTIVAAASANWTPGDDSGANVFRLRLLPTTVVKTTPVPLATNVAASGTQSFGLDLKAPSSSTSNAEQTIPVTVAATAH